MKQIAVLLAEDHTVVREGLRRMLELEEDLQVVGEAGDGRQAVVLAARLRPDVVLMDIAMPRLNGLKATRQIRKADPAARVLILSAHAEDDYIQRATESGAAGFLLKQASAHELCHAIREVHAGKTFFSSVVSRRLDRLKHSAVRTGWRGKPAAQLTSRETEVLQMIAEGRGNKETAGELGISVKTIEKHRANLMSKLDIHDTAGLTRYAIGAGIVETLVKVMIV